MSSTKAAVQAVPQIVFRVVPASQVPPGKTCSLTESEGLITVSIGAGHATRALCEELTRMHQVLTDQGRWVQTSPAESPDRIEQAAEGQGWARVAWLRVPASALPGGVLTASAEKKGMLVLFIHEEHASAQLCTHMMAYAERIAGDGLWRQRWPG